MSEIKHLLCKGILQGLCGGIFFTIIKPDFFEVWWKAGLCWFAFCAFVSLDRWEWEKDD